MSVLCLGSLTKKRKTSKILHSDGNRPSGVYQFDQFFKFTPNEMRLPFPADFKNFLNALTSF
jgi:hypothetical protein